MAGLRAPLPTLRRAPRGDRRTARGQCGSLDLHCRGLPPPTPCRSPGALPLAKSAQAVASAAKRDVRVAARGVARNQAASRSRLTAAAVATCWRCVLASPRERLRRRPEARTPRERG